MHKWPLTSHRGDIRTATRWTPFPHVEALQQSRESTSTITSARHLHGHSPGLPPPHASPTRARRSTFARAAGGGDSSPGKLISATPSAPGKLLSRSPRLTRAAPHSATATGEGDGAARLPRGSREAPAWLLLDTAV
eukprot:CAMPEP_0184534180 /NCGR_PEP_ID=MMETSP0198_2-20121128/15185_1 /TAXON_ID=1112570 /ORGANISM="Thraustochytrium sp., Strain LLF1b" /LENGTH=135 /DNA_ID=CAMNT_0026927071 /DNA_START=436 /DNA_END=840 /DNA_ORIENTATION=+